MPLLSPPGQIQNRLVLRIRSFDQCLIMPVPLSQPTPEICHFKTAPCAGSTRAPIVVQGRVPTVQERLAVPGQATAWSCGGMDARVEPAQTHFFLRCCTSMGGK
jgi:hypothetical protein